jgi:hypothetical protein
MTQQLFARRTLIAAVLILGACAWIVAGGVVLVDSIRVVPTPTVIKVSIKPTVTRSATPNPTAIPPTIAPTFTPTTLAVVPTVDTPMPTVPATEAAAIATAANGCNTPVGWVAYTVEDGDTLFGFSLGSKGQLSVDAIMAGNCLQTKLLSVGQTIFLPQGVAEQSPKVDSGSGGTPLPAGLTRTAHCPCNITIRAGLRLEQVAAAVDAVPVGFTGADFLKTVAPGAPTPDLAFLHSRPGD